MAILCQLHSSEGCKESFCVKLASVDSRKAVKQLPFAETLLVIATSKTNKPYKFKFICF